MRTNLFAFSFTTKAGEKHYHICSRAHRNSCLLHSITSVFNLLRLQNAHLLYECLQLQNTLLLYECLQLEVTEHGRL